MATLDEISSLKAKIVEYEAELNSATTKEEKSEWRSLIISTRETLNLLLKAQGSSTITIFYCANALLVGSNLVKGVRALVYQTFSKIGVPLMEQPKSVLMRHYNSDESDSETYSVAITRITHVTGKNVIDLETELLMVENSSHEDFVGLECYRCHLMSQA
eukprot:gene16621-22711_t